MTNRLEKNCEVRTLSNQDLLSQTKELVEAEREIGIRILHRLKEISRRRLHSELGYSSLFTYLVEELKYPESSAFRLVNAMKITSELPEIEAKIKNGSLSVTTVAQVQSYCQAQKREHGLVLESEEKRELLQAIEGHSKKEVEVILASFNPEYPLPKDREKVRALNQEETEIRIVVDAELMKNLKRIKDLMAHKSWNPSYAELLKEMSEIVLNKIDPARKQSKSGAAEDKVRSQLPLGEVPSRRLTSTPPKSPNSKRTYISVFTRREALKSAGYRCKFQGPDGHRCTETRGLEVEHTLPISHGGTNDLQNLSILCKSHNLYQAVKILGNRKMAEFIQV